jgi:hypothetical protein
MCVGMWCELLLGGDPPPRREVLTVVCGDVVWVAGMFFRVREKFCL